MKLFLVEKEDQAAYAEILPEDLGGEDALLLAATDDETDPETLVGILVLSATSDTTYAVDYIRVAPDYRGRGIAKSLLSYGRFLLQSIGAELLSAGLYWENEEEKEALAPARKALLSSFFEVTATDALYSTSAGQVEKGLQSYRKKMNLSLLRPLSQISDELWDYIRFRQERNDDPDLVYVDLKERSHYDPDRSMVAIDDRQRFTGLILISDLGDAYCIDDLWTSDKSGMTLLSLLAAAGDGIEEDKRILFHPAHPNAQRIAEKLLGKDGFATAEHMAFTSVLA